MTDVRNMSAKLTSEEKGILFSRTYLPFRKHFRKSCYYHIRHLRCIRPYLDSKTASTIATSIVQYFKNLNFTSGAGDQLRHRLPNLVQR